MPKFIFQIKKKFHVFLFISISLVSKKIIFNKKFFNRIVYLLFTPKLSFFSNFTTSF